MRATRGGTAFVAAAFVIACGRAPGAVHETRAAESAARAAMAHYATLLNGAPPNADSVSAQFAPTGELLGSGQAALRGPAAIHAFLASFSQVRVDSAALPVTSSTVAGDRVTLWGTYEQHAVLGTGQSLHPHGRYVAEWVRNSTGAWRIQRLLTEPAP